MLSPLLKSIPRTTRIAAAALWALAILALSVLPARFFPQTDAIGRIPQADKVAHVVMYSVMTALLLWTAAFSGPSRGFRRYGFAAAAAVAFGLLMELLQYYLTTTRSMDLLDALANAVGAFLVAGVGWWLTRKRKA